MRFLTRRAIGLAAALLAGAALAAPASAEELTLVAIHSLTGGLAFLGVPATNAMKLAVDESNARHDLGANTIKLIVYDNASDSKETITLYNRAALQDKALLILGPSDSTRCMVIAPMLNDLKVPDLTTCQSAEALKITPWFFKSTTDPVGAIRPLGEYAVAKLGLKRVAGIYLRDNDGQIGNWRAFEEPVTKAGAQVVAAEGVLQTDTDYAAVATKVAAANPDGVYIGANAEQAANIVLQLRNAGLTNAKIFGSSSLGADYIKTGGKAVDNTYMTLDYDPQSTKPMNVAFAEAYKKRFGIDAENWAALGYTNILTTIDALKHAGEHPTRESLKAAMENQKDVAVLLGNGHWSQTPSRVPEYGIGVFMIKDGKIVPAN